MCACVRACACVRVVAGWRKGKSARWCSMTTGISKSTTGRCIRACEYHQVIKLVCVCARVHVVCVYVCMCLLVYVCMHSPSEDKGDYQDQDARSLHFCNSPAEDNYLKQKIYSYLSKREREHNYRVLAKNRSLPARGHADSSDDELVSDGVFLGEWSCGRWSLERGAYCCVRVGRGRGRAHGFVRILQSREVLHIRQTEGSSWSTRRR